eukprot:13921663-Alexandrium_andersonii.AAC.1
MAWTLARNPRAWALMHQWHPSLRGQATRRRQAIDEGGDNDDVSDNSGGPCHCKLCRALLAADVCGLQRVATAARCHHAVSYTHLTLPTICSV